MKGVDRGLRAAPEADANLFEMTTPSSPRWASTSCRSRSATRSKVMEGADLVHEALGEHIFEWFLRNKRSEWRDYKTHVSQFELDRYLPTLVRSRLDRARLPRSPPPDLARTLDLAGYRWKASLGDERVATPSPERLGWRGRRLRQPTPTRGRCAARCASATRPVSPLLVLVAAASSPTSSCATSCSTTSASPVPPERGRGTAEAPVLARRRACARRSSSTAGSRSTSRPTRRRSRAPARPDVHGVRAAQVPRPEPRQGVHPRDAAVRVWGYEYYGGARTVDVHIRRLRAKLGEEHANLIQTVRSVGYRFGQSRWGRIGPHRTGRGLLALTLGEARRAGAEPLVAEPSRPAEIGFAGRSSEDVGRQAGDRTPPEGSAFRWIQPQVPRGRRRRRRADRPATCSRTRLPNRCRSGPRPRESVPLRASCLSSCLRRRTAWPSGR
jgi:hypothetical protein